MTVFRLTLDLGEETRACWQAAAERIDYERLDVWAYDTLDAAADPEAGQVVGVETIGDPERVGLRARLTTAETERDEWRVTAETLRDMENEAAKGLLRRVEALSEAARPFAEHAEQAGDRARLRAALACPPQQRGE